MIEVYTDAYFMKKAYEEALIAGEGGEVPIGAIVVCRNQIIAKAHNQTEILKDVTAHAEVLAITAASNYLGSKFLDDCEMYVTLEPCLMCAGAIKWSRIGKLVYAASDDKSGFMNYGKEVLHRSTKLEFGVMHDECSQIVKDFFAKRR